MSPDTVIAYVYKAAVYCPTHMIETLITEGEASPAARDMDSEQALTQIAEANGLDRFDESTFDSGDFPKVCFASDEFDHDCDVGHPLD